MTGEPLPESLPRTFREFTPVTYAMVKNYLDQDHREHERLIARREVLKDKMRSGLTTLNAGSLLALLAALNGEGAAATWFGIDSSNVKWMAGLFTLGLILAAVSFRIAETDARVESSDSLIRVLAIERLIARYEGKPTIEEHDQIAKEFQAYTELPIVGHRFSDADFWCLALSQTCWLVGILMPLQKAVFG